MGVAECVGLVFDMRYADPFLVLTNASFCSVGDAIGRRKRADVKKVCMLFNTPSHSSLNQKTQNAIE